MTPFFWAQNFGFWPKNPIFAIRPQFWSMTHFYPSAWRLLSHLRNDFSTFRSGVTAISVKKSSWPVKKSSPLPLWEFRLPVKALALSGRRPFGPARFAHGLDNANAWWRQCVCNKNTSCFACQSQKMSTFCICLSICYVLSSLSQRTDAYGSPDRGLFLHLYF